MNEKPITVRDIVIEYLKAHKYGGLYNEAGKCGCPIEKLVPCEGGIEHCSPGHETHCGGRCGDLDACITRDGECPELCEYDI